MKKHILLFCGGQSSEHEVSLRSAANVFKAMDPEKFDISIVGIDHQGQWHKLNSEALLKHHGMTQVETKPREFSALTLQPGEKNSLIKAEHMPSLPKVDMVFPVLHGPNGEDGTIQGLLRLMNMPFVGCDVLGSAVCMDKDVTKRLLRDANIPMADFLTFYAHQQPLDFETIKDRLKLPMFVKPCNMGSSVGISKVSTKEEFEVAVKLAFTHDKKILIEEAMVGREIECAVLGNEDAKASVLGEIIPRGEFYSYEAKYLDENGASLVIPADLPEEVTKKVQAYALEIFRLLECSDLARVDFFVTKDNQIYLNEVNTMPGFTSVSMFPMLWQATGVSYPALIEKLIDLAHERFVKAQKIKH